MSKPQSLVKVVLSTGKVAFLRPIKISDTELAAQQVSVRANGDINVLQIMMQKALVQMLLMRTAANETEEPKTLTGNEKEDLDSVFDMSEYGQILRVVGKMSGIEEGAGKLGMPKMELVSFS